MKRETRANLIFLVIFLLLAVPGIVKLARKSYVSGKYESAMRAPVHDRFAYMDPTPPRGMPRVVPPGVGALLGRIVDRLQTMQPGLRSVLEPGADQPIMSDALNLQLLGRGSSNDRYNVALFGWNSRYAPLPELYEITATRGGEQLKGQIVAYEPQILSLELRSELQDLGYVVPPDSVLWMVVSFPGEAPVETVSIHYHLDKTVLDDTIRVAPPTTAPTTAPTTEATTEAAAP